MPLKPRTNPLDDAGRDSFQVPLTLVPSIMAKSMSILAIETSCDETAIALVHASGGLKSPRFKVLKNLVASQIKIHRPFGGVVPNLAKREHLKNLPKILNSIFRHPISPNYRANIRRSDVPKIDAVAVTVGPGLEPCLWTGINFAKDLAKKLSAPGGPASGWKKTTPLIGVNHLEGHLYSNWLSANRHAYRQAGKSQIVFPAVALIVSGGHTILLLMNSLTKWEKLGETRDDAAGEAFDKVARLLGLPYPGGPEIERLAKKGNATSIKFPRPMMDQKNYDFSFSGLKTAVLYYLRDNPRANKAHVAASFQEAVVEVLVKKTIRAAVGFGAKSVLLCGGVSANRALRKTLALQATRYKLQFHVPSFEYNTDNAAMIAAAAYIQFLKNKKPRITAQPNLNF